MGKSKMGLGFHQILCRPDHLFMCVAKLWHARLGCIFVSWQHLRADLPIVARSSGVGPHLDLSIDVAQNWANKKSQPIKRTLDRKRGQKFVHDSLVGFALKFRFAVPLLFVL